MIESTKPIIGLTLDYEETDSYASFPWYALRENYASAVSKHGGVPIMLPHDLGALERYLSIIDGLIVTGGDFDINPAMYGAGEVHETVVIKDRRTACEAALLEGMLKQDRPVLGICGGEQLINVVLGGTLIQHIPDSVDNALEHEQKNPKDEPSHQVSITEGSRLFDIVGNKEIAVNSTHHQAVETIGEKVIINAVAPDGVIEGIESTEHRFCVGVQWHPEYGTSEADRLIMKAFIESC